ncbi:MAG: phosphatidylserine decarboxylase [Spirochaetes bacterium RBG_13_51_14]|nr:MAG: phosphatidylserine decarboxylase [Spirochaetes bacterium RBG_13_51_14]
MNKTKALSIFIYRIIPKSLISRIFGHIVLIPLPQSLMDSIIRWYSAKYNVKDEYHIPPGGFRNFDDFFTRIINKETHPIDPSDNCAISPVDARIDQYGEIREAAIIQAKGLDYSIRELIPSDTYIKFIWGKFITLYLSPGDYHRIHAPVGGSVIGYFNIPGKLFTVQDWLVKSFPGLFVKNERIVSYIASNAGTVAVCKIGAFNVGKITLSYCGVWANRTFRRRHEIFFDQGARVPVRTGDELGVFHLGSTVILLFQKDAITFDDFKVGDKIRMGERIGTLKNLKKK